MCLFSLNAYFCQIFATVYFPNGFEVFLFYVSEIKLFEYILAIFIDGGNDFLLSLKNTIDESFLSLDSLSYQFSQGWKYDIVTHFMFRVTLLAL